jgi:hypothetical protein
LPVSKHPFVEQKTASSTGPVEVKVFVKTTPGILFATGRHGV